ncbi:unnamed protein product [Fusarium langsethiae]|nr:unnamed protein product [Fusarium langsethiae]
MRLQFFALAAALVAGVTSASAQHNADLSDSSVGPGLLISDESVPPSGLMVECLPMEEPLVRRDTPEPSEGECFHGPAAPTLNKDAPDMGGAVGCTYYPDGPDPTARKYKLIPGDEGAAIQNVSITAAFESMDPLQIRMTINNTTPLPITFWEEWSPVSKHGWELGYYSIESEIWGQFFGRVGQQYRMSTLDRSDVPKRPENIEELVQLNPGESFSQVVTIPYCEPQERWTEVCKPYMWERWTEMLRLAGIKRIFIQGDWYGVWAQPKEEVMANMVDNPMTGYWTRWWTDHILIPTHEQHKEFGTYLPLNKPWYETEAALEGAKPENNTSV